MSFIDNITQILGIGEVNPQTFRLVLLGESGCYIEGVKSLKDFSDTKVEISLKTCQLVVKGEGLKIGKYYCGDMVVLGKISAVERL